MKRATCKKHKVHRSDCVDCRVEESKRHRAAEQPQEPPKIVRQGFPCQHGERCEWAAYTGGKPFCSRVIAGCAKI